MTEVVQMRVFERPGLEESANLKAVRNLASQVVKLFAIPEVMAGINKAHVFGASSAKVQEVILKKMIELDFKVKEKGFSRI